MSILDLHAIHKVFGTRRHPFAAVKGVSFSIEAGQVFGLVGESGSGKTTVARCAIRLIPATSGTASFLGHDLAKLSGRELRRLRVDLGMVFQNPVAALNPRIRVGQLIAEPLRTHTTLSRGALQARVLGLLSDVGLGPEFAERLPHQLSGGQCQRVGIARAIATTPKLIVLDEPTSALDVSVQAQILNLLRDLREKHDLTYLLISHDLDVVRYMCDEVAVMRGGEVVERGPAGAVLTKPEHDYTKTLLAATPGHRKAP